MSKALVTLSRGRSGGFTAIELLVVLALVAIFMVMALPSFDSTIKRYRVSAAASEIGSVLQFARAEAIRTRKNVTVGKTGTPDAGCADSGVATDWRCGLAVFADDNTTSIKTISAVDLKGLKVNSSAESIVYAPLGFVYQGGEDSMIFVGPSADGDTPATSPYASYVCFGAGGRINVVSDSTGCSPNAN